MARPKGKWIAAAAGALALAVLGLATYLEWPRIRFWYSFETLGRNAQGFPEYLHRRTGIVLVRLPGGKSWMGAQKTDPGGQNFDPEAKDDEGPVHEITLSPFMIGKHEVTQRQWKTVMGSNPSHFKGDDLPVEQVSWEDIQEFERRTGLSLPTEAEWEYACRAGTTTPIAGTGKLDDMGWYGENSGSTTHPVGQKAPNNFGLHDLHGNVWEWCEDLYDEVFYGKPEVREPDPVSVVGVGDRVLRGDGWVHHAGVCHAATRNWLPPEIRIDNLGCRLACRSP